MGAVHTPVNENGSYAGKTASYRVAVFLRKQPLNEFGLVTTWTECTITP
jgi:hypothetical protein